MPNHIYSLRLRLRREPTQSRPEPAVARVNAMAASGITFCRPVKPVSPGGVMVWPDTESPRTFVFESVGVIVVGSTLVAPHVASSSDRRGPSCRNRRPGRRTRAIAVRGRSDNYDISIVVPAGSDPARLLPPLEHIVSSFDILE